MGEETGAEISKIMKELKPTIMKGAIKEGTKARDEKEAISLHDRVIPSEKSNHLWENDGNEWPTIQLGLRWILTRLNERERQSSITPNSLRETRIKKLPQL